ncbi:MAG TPA: N-acetylneuraminate synthase family protein [Terriglobales bacterium]
MSAKTEIPGVQIGSKTVGPGRPAYVIAEIGINHNGDIELAEKLISVAAAAGCDAVKFQKRTPEVCVPHAQREILRETPWGVMTYMEYRKRVEFGEAEYARIDEVCRAKGIQWFASCWDEESIDFMERFNTPCYKVASATLTDEGILRKLHRIGKPVILSTGMSSVEEIDEAVARVGKKNLVLLHSVSTYPAHYEELNLRVIPFLQERYQIPIGYSGHETGLPSSVAAVVLGACVVERHVTLDRAMWGSDHAASLEPNGITRLVRDIRLVETAMGDGIKRVMPRELPILEKLRRSKANAATS